MPSFVCDAILFDLDGVLVDSTASIDRQWRIWCREHGIDAEQLTANMHGVRSIEVIRRFAPHLDAESEQQALEKREAADREGVVTMPGALELIASLPEDRWCVVTSGSLFVASARLSLIGVMPKVLITADDVKNGKPNPEPYLKGAARLKIDPRECVVIEDAPAGIRAAHAAGAKAIAITSTCPASALGEAEVVIKSLTQVKVEIGDSERLILAVDDEIA